MLGIGLCAVLSVELAQYLTARGNADIDDVILNLSGMMAVWGILHIPPVARMYADAVQCLPGKDYFS